MLLITIIESDKNRMESINSFVKYLSNKMVMIGVANVGWLIAHSAKDNIVITRPEYR